MTLARVPGAVLHPLAGVHTSIPRATTMGARVVQTNVEVGVLVRGWDGLCMFFHLADLAIEVGKAHGERPDEYREPPFFS